jgi:hypothetical protein
MTDTYEAQTPMLSLSDSHLLLDIYQKSIDKAESYQRLQENKDFQELFLNGYFKEEPVRLTSLLSIVAIGDKVRIIDDLSAISCTSAYLNNLENEASEASKNKFEVLSVITELESSSETSDV